MGVFARRSSLPFQSKDYRKYKPYVREDFEQCCAYCLLHESLAGGYENYELDHFRPKSIPAFAHLLADFYNLYYACHPCNLTKGAKWPSAELIKLGYTLVDFCEDGFSRHFQEEPDGTWRPLTKSGEYSQEMLRLNRPHLRTIRHMLRRLMEGRGAGKIDWNEPNKNDVISLLEDHR